MPKICPISFIQMVHKTEKVLVIPIASRLLTRLILASKHALPEKAASSSDFLGRLG